MLTRTLEKINRKNKRKEKRYLYIYVKEKGFMENHFLFTKTFELLRAANGGCELTSSSLASSLS